MNYKFIHFEMFDWLARSWVIISPAVPLTYRKRRYNGDVLWMHAKPRFRVIAGNYEKIKIPPSSSAHRPVPSKRLNVAAPRRQWRVKFSQTDQKATTNKRSLIGKSFTPCRFSFSHFTATIWRSQGCFCFGCFIWCIGWLLACLCDTPPQTDYPRRPDFIWCIWWL